MLSARIFSRKATIVKKPMRLFRTDIPQQFNAPRTTLLREHSIHACGDFSNVLQKDLAVPSYHAGKDFAILFSTKPSVFGKTSSPLLRGLAIASNYGYGVSKCVNAETYKVLYVQYNITLQLSFVTSDHEFFMMSVELFSVSARKNTTNMTSRELWVNNYRSKREAVVSTDR